MLFQLQAGSLREKGLQHNSGGAIGLLTTKTVGSIKVDAFPAFFGLSSPDLFTRLFSQNSFMPHGHCYLWNPGLMRLHLISDFLIAAAYFVIPIALLLFVRKRRDLPFNWMFVCFGVFILACGMTHVMEIITLWKPYYWISGIVKAITALASVPTAILLIRLIPSAINVPGPAVLRAANEALIEQTKLLNLIVTNMGDGLLVVDRDGAALLRLRAVNSLYGLVGAESKQPLELALAALPSDWAGSDVLRARALLAG